LGFDLAGVDAFDVNRAYHPTGRRKSDKLAAPTPTTFSLRGWRPRQP